MLKTVRATVTPSGSIVFDEPVNLIRTTAVLVTFLDEQAALPATTASGPIDGADQDASAGLSAQIEKPAAHSVGSMSRSTMQTYTFECEVDSSRHLVLDLPPSVAPGRHRVSVITSAA